MFLMTSMGKSENRPRVAASGVDDEAHQLGAGLGHGGKAGVGAHPPPILVTARALALDRPVQPLVGQLGEHLLDDHVDLTLVVTEVVEEAAQRRVGDLQLRRGQLEVVVDRLHGAKLTSGQATLR